MQWISTVFFAIGIYAWAFLAPITWKTLAWFPVYFFCLALITGVV